MYFSWSESKSQDDFLEDMSDFLDPRYNNANATLFMCSTAVYNWLHKLGGYMTANAKEAGDGSLANSFARLDMNYNEQVKEIWFGHYYNIYTIWRYECYS